MSNKPNSTELPPLPKGKEYEELVAAYLQATGRYYLDRNIIQREIEEILELDIIISDYNYLPRPKLIEIKSGGWGFPDIFKIRGWMDYTNIQKGFLIVQQTKDHINFIKRRAKTLNIEVHQASDPDKIETQIGKLLKNVKPDWRDVVTFRYSYWLERNMLQYLKNCKSKYRDVRCYIEADQYHHRVNSGVFFSQSIIDKINNLYVHFQKHDHLSARCGHELMPPTEFTDVNHIPYPAFKKTFWACEFNMIQVSALLEYQSRLAILKNVVDYIIYHTSVVKKSVDRKFGNLDDENGFDLLPRNCQNALGELGGHKCYKRYPIFWQWFILAFGGFIIEEIKEREYELLSEKTGVDIDEIDNALSALDILFPTKDGWLFTHPTSRIRETSLFSMPFRGIGAYYRGLMYTDPKDEKASFKDIGLSNRAAVKDLTKWNNLAVKVISNNHHID